MDGNQSLCTKLYQVLQQKSVFDCAVHRSASLRRDQCAR
jgi:hypothetical protein